MKKEEIRDIFKSLIGNSALQHIEGNNWVDFSFSSYREEVITLEFLEKDSKGDIVIHQSILYGLDTEKWVSGNCVDPEDIEHDSYMDLKEHLDLIEGDILSNGFNITNLPTL